MADEHMEDEAAEAKRAAEAETLATPEVVTKYKAAADIANRALAAVVAACLPGATVLSLCALGDKFVEDECAKVFTKKTKEGAKLERGLAFPTCVSLNHCVCHWCSDESDATALAPGDWAKVDLACHIDGYAACVAHTLVVPPSAGEPAPPAAGRQGDLLACGAAAVELLQRLVRPGERSGAVAPALASLAQAYGVSLVEGVLMHQNKRFVLDGNKVVLAKGGPELRAQDVAFDPFEVYTLDVVLSTGDGKPKLQDERQTGVFKRALDKKQNLKMKAGRAVFGDVLARFPTLPFSLRALAAGAEGGATRVRLGLRECLGAELVTAFPVLWEKSGEQVAHFKATLLLLPSGPDKVTGHPSFPAHVSDKALDDPALLALLAQPVKVDKKAAKKAAKAAAAAAGGEGGDAGDAAAAAQQPPAPPAQ